MTDDRKQELTQLLEEAMDGLQIGVPLANRNFIVTPTLDGVSSTFNLRVGPGAQQIPINILQNYLKKRWTSYGLDSSSVLMHLKFYLPDDNTESKLLDFIREELSPFIHENEIRSASYAIKVDTTNRICLHHMQSGLIGIDILLEHLLRIAIAYGIEKAVLDFHRCSCLEGAQDLFQDIVSLEGITLETETQVCEGAQLVPFPSPTTPELASYLPGYLVREFGSNKEVNRGKTLLIIDRPMFSIFHRPSEETFQKGIRVDGLPFQFALDDIKFLNDHTVHSFRKSMCQALSLVCNSSVQIARTWRNVPEDKLFRPFHSSSIGYNHGPFGHSTEVEQTEIKKAKCLYNKLVNLDSDVDKKLEIATDRWIKSKANKDNVDKMIDLGIVFETLYLPKGNIEQLAFQFRLRASWHLGKDKADRQELIDEFKAIYTLRSKAVHNGVVPDKIRIRKGEVAIATSKFIPRAQDLCRDSILKILEDGEFPDWNDLILGEESM